MVKVNSKSQKGRSMVEMLGVLAIIGVLSVGGVYGYGVAMKKHKANELLHQASMLATTISAQIQSKGELPQSIENFGDAKYGTFNPPSEANAEQFTMQITGTDSAVCEQMEKMAVGMVRKAECNGTTLTLTYNNNLSTDKVAADYNGDETGEKCEGAGYKWCSELSTPACKKDCCSGITLNSCQESCDSSTGEITLKDDEIDCTTSDGKKGTCNAGVCEETPTCSSTVGDPCTDNATVCPGYYCSIAGGTIGGSGAGCGTDTYTPGAGSVATLGTPETKGSYKASPEYVASWEAAVNYCAALGRDGLVTHGRLPNVPSECSMGNECSALPNDGYYWLNGLVQYDCNWENYSTTYGGNSCYAFIMAGWAVRGYRRDNGYGGGYALCE